MWDRQCESYGKGTIREAYLTNNESIIIDVDYDDGEKDKCIKSIKVNINAEGYVELEFKRMYIEYCPDL